MSAYGVDISKHQSREAVGQVVRGGKASFIILRRSVGTARPDERFYDYARAVKAAGIKTGVYVANYSKNGREAAAEADYAIDLVEKTGLKMSLPVFFDWEYFSANYIKENFGVTVTARLLQDMAFAFCERVKARGYAPGIYLNKDFWDRFYGDGFFARHPDYKIWYARPGLSKPDKDCYIWQYASNDGADFGYTGGAIDKDILYGEFIGDEPEPMRPFSSAAVRLWIGYASPGDVRAIKAVVEGLGILCEEKDGYMATGYASSGDQCYILRECQRLGVPCVLYDGQDLPADKQDTGDKPREKEPEKESGGEAIPAEPAQPEQSGAESGEKDEDGKEDGESKEASGGPVNPPREAGPLGGPDKAGQEARNMLLKLFRAIIRAIVRFFNLRTGRQDLPGDRRDRQ